MARSRRTPAMLPGRCSLELSDRKLQRKIKSHKLRAKPRDLQFSSSASAVSESETADPSAPPYFLSRVVTSISCVWFSLERTTSVVVGESSEAGNPGTLGMTKRKGRRSHKKLL